MPEPPRSPGTLRDCPRSPGGATARSQGRQPLDGDPDPNPSPRRPPNPGRRPGLGGRLGESDGRTGTRADAPGYVLSPPLGAEYGFRDSL